MKLSEKERRALEYLSRQRRAVHAEDIGAALEEWISFDGRRGKAARGSAIAKSLCTYGFVASQHRGIYEYVITEAGRAALAQAE